MNKKKVIVAILFEILLIIGIIFIAKIVVNKNDNKKNTDAKSKETNTIIDKPDIELIKEYDNQVPILCYHGVLDDAWGDKSIFVKIEEFEKQMQYLSENGYTSLFITEIEEANKYEKPIIITFDDGYKDVYINAFPILKKYNMKATLYIISEYLGGGYYLTKDMLQELAKSPLIEIGSHTVNHKVLTKASSKEVEKQLAESKKMLEEITGKKVESLAYPTGAYNESVIETTKKYYKYAISIVEGKENPKNLNTYDLRRLYMLRDYDINKFKEIIEE